MKIATIIGMRPEIIRLARVMAALDRYTDHIIIHTGQNYDDELNQIFFDDLELRRPDFFLEAAGQTAAETICLMIARVSAVLRAAAGGCAGVEQHQPAEDGHQVQGTGATPKVAHPSGRHSVLKRTAQPVLAPPGNRASAGGRPQNHRGRLVVYSLTL